MSITSRVRRGDRNLMSRQQTPEEEFDAKQQLLTYCAENQIASPFQDLPFEWVTAVSVPQSPPPSLIDAFPTLEPTFEDAPFDAETGLADYLGTVLSLGNGEDVHATRTWPTSALEFLTPFQHGEDAFRRFGPVNLKNSALFLPTETPKGERGMEISADRSEFDAAITKDGRLAATQEDAWFLKFIISENTQPAQSDHILPKPSWNCLILSPPLLPYQSDFVEVARPPIPAAEPVSTQLSSQEFWDRFPSLSPQCIDTLLHNPRNSSPAKVASKESDFIFNLKVEIPLTPNSTKKVSQKNDQHTLKSIASIVALEAIPRMPDSPEVSPSRVLRTLETQLFNEQYSAAQSLRLQLPQLLPSSPRTNIFPNSLLGLFLTTESLSWHVIPQSELDVLNGEMKWLPFSKVSKTLDTSSEDVEGNWEDFVDYTGVPEDDGSLLANWTSHQEEEELEHMEPSNFTSKEEEMDEFLGVIEEVRKRKSIAPNFPGEESGKRLKFAHTSRIAEYMRSQRGRSVDLSDDEALENIRILESNQTEQVYATPIHVLQMNQNTVAPTNEMDPLTAVSAVIFSTSILEHHYLTTFLRETLVNTTFFERDLTTNADGAVEGDIIVSANRCILFSTVAQITQTLPSNTSHRILGVAAKYRQVEILVLCPCAVKGKDLVQFLGWTEKVGNVRVVLADGEEAVKPWVLWLCLWRELDRSSFKDHLREDESEDELFLRRVFNVYNSQVILGRMTLAEFLDLSHEMRVESFHDVASERCLKLLLDDES